jgi:hypothetical protein
VVDYEEQFFGLMNDYLPERSSPVVFSPLGLLFISMLTVATAFVGSVWSIRTSTGVTTVGQATTDSHTNRVSRIWFAVWITAVSALSLGIYVIGIYAVGASWALSGTSKTVGITILIGYLSVATLVITWAIRSRRSQSRIAWLIPLIAIGATAATTAAIITIL